MGREQWWYVDIGTTGESASRRGTSAMLETAWNGGTMHSDLVASSAGTSDRMLVVAVIRRREDALTELYRRHGGSLFCAALRVLSARGPAEEVVQDIFMALWCSPERFDPDRGSVRAFLLAQCHGRAVDIVRSAAARQRREERDANAVRTPYVLEDQVMDFVDAQTVRDAVAKLCEPEREAISLAYFGGHSYVQAASMLGIPEGTVKSRIRTGLARLRDAVLEAGINPAMANAGGWLP